MSQIFRIPFRLLSIGSDESRAKRYRLHADRLRELANAISNPAERAELLKIAEACERLADRFAPEQC